MASGTSNNPLPTDQAGRSGQDVTVNLQIISPSVGVNRPLLFPDVPATTTIKQLKERIRQTLPLRPADCNQRLIHRGRALMCETDNLLDIFGPDALRSPDRQTIHLVIRDPTEGHASSSPAPNSGRGSSPAVVASHAPTPVVVQQAVQMSFGPQPTSGPNGRTQSQPAIAAGSGSRLPSPAPNPAAAQPDATMSFHQQHQNMANWISQIQREAMTRAIVHQNQRGRAQMGMRGIGDPTGGHHHPGGNPADSSGGRSSPAPTHTIYREAFGPNGHSFHVETVIRPSAPGQQNGLSPIDVQNILRSADVNQAAAAAMASATAAQRSAPGPPPVHGRPLNQPGVTTPVFGSGGVPTAGSGRATPDVGARTAHAASSLPLPLSNFANSPRQGLEVYILSSPEGPRALLLNNATSEAFYTPRLRPQSSMPHLRTVPSFPNLSFAAATSPHAPPNIGHQPPRFDGHEQQQQPRQQYQPAQANHGGVANGQTPIDAPIQQQQQPQPQPQPQPQQRQRQRQPRLHPANPPAAGIPPLLLRAWPHMWLVIRLAVFVWLFTSPNSSWSRWFTVICLAGLVFLLSTGILNGVAENAWRPIGHHLQNLLPTPEQHAQRQRRVAAGRGAPEQEQPLIQAGDADPAQMAARLVADRQGRQQTWLGAQVRRLERASLLFLASIAPGVAERHIANLEAEARAEEARRREAEAQTEAATGTAAETAAATAEPPDATSVSDANQGGETHVDQNSSEGGIDTQARHAVVHENPRQEESAGAIEEGPITGDLVEL